MLSLVITLVDTIDAMSRGLRCQGMDEADIEARYKANIEELPTCDIDVVALMMLRYGLDGDMVSSVAVCTIHMNAIKMSIRQGIIIDANFLS